MTVSENAEMAERYGMLYERYWKDHVAVEAIHEMLRYRESLTDTGLQSIAAQAYALADAMWGERQRRWVEERRKRGNR